MQALQGLQEQNKTTITKEWLDERVQAYYDNPCKGSLLAQDNPFKNALQAIEHPNQHLPNPGNPNSPLMALANTFLTNSARVFIMKRPISQQGAEIRQQQAIAPQPISPSPDVPETILHPPQNPQPAKGSTPPNTATVQEPEDQTLESQLLALESQLLALERREGISSAKTAESSKEKFDAARITPDNIANGMTNGRKDSPAPQRPEIVTNHRVAPQGSTASTTSLSDEEIEARLSALERREKS